jgi:hypothetical protein
VIVLSLGLLAVGAAQGQRHDARAPAAASVRTVTSTADAGAGSLRRALLDASAGDTIRFSTATFPPSSPAAIALAGPLPPISQNNLTIDASDAGVILDGSSAGNKVPGLLIQVDGVTVRGLRIVNFDGCGIEVRGQNNTIGGSRAAGAAPLGQGNLLSGNGHSGVCLFDGGNHNTVRGNLIGVDATGLNVSGSQGDGVHINGGDHNLIEANVISSQRASGIQITSANGAYNTVRNNLIGVGSDGSTATYNFDKGVNIHNGAHHNVIGPGNIIAYTRGSNGIAIAGGLAPHNTIWGNSIFDNEGSGILLWNENVDLVRTPAITGFDLAAGAVSGLACPGCLVQIYSDQENEGRTYLGEATANAQGVFSFSKGSPISSPHVTATATDPGGATSMFSVPTAGRRSIMIQAGNSNLFERLPTRKAEELPDNRLGFNIQDQGWVDAGIADADVLNHLGIKTARGQMNDPDSYQVNWSTDELMIHDRFDRLITDLEADGIEMTYILIFWDKAHCRQTGSINVPRFQTEAEIQRYLQFVRIMVGAFGDRVDTWEIWNEPGFEGSYQWIRVADYISLIKRAIPVIHAEDPGSRIIVGSHHGWHGEYYKEYLYRVLESDVMPLVDVVAWHPYIVHLHPDECGGEFFDRYPAILAEIKSIARAHGFRGEFRADELRFATRLPSTAEPCTVSDRTAGKYYAREIIHHLGEDVGAGILLTSDTQAEVMKHLGTLTAGARPAALPVAVSGAPSVVSYTFSLPAGDRLVALWKDVDIVDVETATPVTLNVPEHGEYTPYGIDPLTGVQQRLAASPAANVLVIRNLLVRDYPLIVRLSPRGKTYLPAVARR